MDSIFALAPFVFARALDILGEYGKVSIIQITLRRME